MRITILSLGLLAAVATVRADEETLSRKELPRAVRAAVKANFPEAKVTGAAREKEGGKTVYEVSLEDDDQAVDVLLSARGKILEVEKTIPAKKLPKPVASAIKAKFPRSEIKKAEQIVKYEADEADDEEEADDDDDDETKFFEVVLTTKGKDDVEVKLSPRGKILAEEDEAEDGGKKAKAKKERGDDEDDDNDKEVKSKKEKGGKKVKAKKDKDEDDEKGEKKDRD